MLRIAVAFARATATPDARLCTACIDVLDVSGVGITVLGGDRTGPLCVSNDRAGALEDLQFTTGDGPCRDAYRSNEVVSAAHLDADASGRWPTFVELAATVGFGAVFAYPLSTHGTTVGVLTVYQDAPGALSPAQHDDSVVVAEVLGETLLSLQASAPDGDLAPGLDVAVAYRAQIHQASGMIAVQLQIPPDDALARIRAYAFAHDLSVDAVATEIVDRRLRLTDDDRPDQGT